MALNLLTVDTLSRFQQLTDEQKRTAIHKVTQVARAWEEMLAIPGDAFHESPIIEGNPFSAHAQPASLPWWMDEECDEIPSQ